MPRYIAIATVWALMSVVIVAETPTSHEMLVGNWVLKTCEQSGRMRKSITMITGVDFKKDSTLDLSLYVLYSDRSQFVTRLKNLK
jgi:hypothetical protein